MNQFFGVSRALVSVMLAVTIGMPMAVSAEVLQDPTRPLMYQVKEKKKPALTLQAIYERSGFNEAVINGRQVKVGDRVHNARISKITQDRVLYVEDGVTHSLRLRASIF
ncbi:hypothetical protein TDB9533_02402 [Thalassocella blandensis]|nr:hypothetical protein TDB9533_02402 [Thalassocella blandensis]